MSNPSGRLCSAGHPPTGSRSWGGGFERGGFQFQLLDESGQPIGDVFSTNSMDHARSDELPTGRTYTLHELPLTRPGITPAPDQPVELNKGRVVVRVINQVSQPGGYAPDRRPNRPAGSSQP